MQTIFFYKEFKLKANLSIFPTTNKMMYANKGKVIKKIKALTVTEMLLANSAFQIVSVQFRRFEDEFEIVIDFVVQ